MFCKCTFLARKIRIGRRSCLSMSSAHSLTNRYSMGKWWTVCWLLESNVRYLLTKGIPRSLKYSEVFSGLSSIQFGEGNAEQETSLGLKEKWDHWGTPSSQKVSFVSWTPLLFRTVTVNCNNNLTIFQPTCQLRHLTQAVLSKDAETFVWMYVHLSVFGCSSPLRWME